jgi:hypothetical protein
MRQASTVFICNGHGKPRHQVFVSPSLQRKASTSNNKIDFQLQALQQHDAEDATTHIFMRHIEDCNLIKLFQYVCSINKKVIRGDSE